MDAFLIALGANLGQREYYIEQAIEAICRNCGEIRATAPIFESAPWGGTADQPFLNTVLICRTPLTPHELLAALLDIEKVLGRVRDRRWGNRTIDCDIILWQKADGEYPIIETKDLLIPHPSATLRDFVLAPAAAIAGDWMHPIENLSISELWQAWQSNAQT